MLRRANFFVTNKYVECEELECGIYRQHIGPAMGTSSSVVYAVIFMIRLETQIIEDPRFRQFIKPYKQFIDDIFLIWTGSAAALCVFRRALASADEAFELDWGGYERQADGYPRVFVREVFRQVTWARRARMLEPKRKERGSQFFETYRACVLTPRNAPERPALRVQLTGASKG